MKKIVRNKKGFTLIELMAVIVILAVVMLLVANRIGNTSKDAKGRSFYLEVKSIKRTIEQECLLKNSIDSSYVSGLSDSDISVLISGETVTVETTEKSKFKNISVYDEFSNNNLGIKYTGDKDGKEPKATFTIDCSVGTTTPTTTPTTTK